MTGTEEFKKAFNEVAMKGYICDKPQGEDNEKALEQYNHEYSIAETGFCQGARWMECIYQQKMSNAGNIMRDMFKELDKQYKEKGILIIQVDDFVSKIEQAILDYKINDSADTTAE